MRIELIITLTTVLIINTVISGVEMDCYHDTDYVNKWEGVVHSIKGDHYFAGMSSYYNSAHEDRRFKYRYCKPRYPQPAIGPFGSDTIDGLYTSEYDEAWSLSCKTKSNHGDSAIRGIQSYFNPRYHDRKYQISCGPLNRDIYRLEDCKWTDYLNEFDQKIDNFRCEENGVIRSIGSYHDNNEEDRRYRLECCNITNAWQFSNIAGYWSSPCAGCDVHAIEVQFGMQTESSSRVTTNMAKSLSAAVSVGFDAKYVSSEVSVGTEISQSVEQEMSATFNQYQMTTLSYECYKTYFYQWMMYADVDGPNGGDTIIIASDRYLCTDNVSPPKCVPGQCHSFLANDIF